MNFGKCGLACAQQWPVLPPALEERPCHGMLGCTSPNGKLGWRNPGALGSKAKENKLFDNQARMTPLPRTERYLGLALTVAPKTPQYQT